MKQQVNAYLVLWCLMLGVLVACGRPDDATGAGLQQAEATLPPYPFSQENVPILMADPSASSPTPLQRQAEPTPRPYPIPTNTPPYDVATPLPPRGPTSELDASVVAIPTDMSLELPPPTIDMYETVIDQFFGDRSVISIIDSDIVTQTLIAFDPRVPDDFPAELQTQIISQIMQHPQLASFRQTEQPQPGGIVISFGEPRNDDNAHAMMGKAGPTIFFAIHVIGDSCAGFLSQGYFLRETEQGWTAQVYMFGVC